MARRPDGIADHLEQLREPIRRSSGVTPSERYLGTLADKTFLNLWSYANPFRDQKLPGGSDGKELCDLLVVCDPHIIIFSEKNISWPDKPINIAWPRWYKKAIDASVAQLRGAERWINEFPERIFLDRICTHPFPLTLPAKDRRIVHRVVVAHGAASACRNHFQGGTGSFVIRPDIEGTQHFNPASPNYAPFCIGDVDPEGDFVHVLDSASLGTVLKELDTISDLTRYFDRRAEFLRSGHLLAAHGEEDLLAYYAVRTNAEGRHDFVPPEGGTWDEVGPINLDGSHFPGMISDPRYTSKKRADKISYAWDTLIESFTGHMLGGTSIVLPGFEYSLTDSEVAFRFMALESRLDRRGLSEAFLGALALGESKEIFFRAVLSPEGGPIGTGFFFLTVKYQNWMNGQGGYERYRLFRTGYAEVYATALLMKHPTLERVIGIAAEPPNQGRGSSEDCLYMAQRDWTEEERKRNRADCDQLRIMGSLQTTRFHHEEYPSIKSSCPSGIEGPHGGTNRRERRARAAMLRKSPDWR